MQNLNRTLKILANVKYSIRIKTKCFVLSITSVPLFLLQSYSVTTLVD